MKSLAQLRHGFTLVETAIAIAVAGFAMVSLAGLLNFTVQTDGALNREAALVAMTDYTMTELSAATFDSLWLAQPTAIGSTAASTATPTDSHYYFTSAGSPIADLDSAKPNEVVYECVVKKTPDADTRSPNGGNYNLMKVQLQFYWPYATGASASRQPNQSIYANIARY